MTIKSNEGRSIIVNEDKEYKSLKNIDDKMKTIELQLDDIEEN